MVALRNTFLIALLFILGVAAFDPFTPQGRGPVADADLTPVRLTVQGNFTSAIVEHNLPGGARFPVREVWSRRFMVKRGTWVELSATRQGTARLECRVIQEKGVGQIRESTTGVGVTCVHLVR